MIFPDCVAEACHAAGNRLQSRPLCHSSSLCTGRRRRAFSKGKDLIAVKIRELAEQHSIPIVEDKPLAKSMDDSVNVDRVIPPEFYKSVGEIIHILYAKSPRKTSAK
jgi:type III secretion system FlhB-like substrate exporter